MTSLTERLRAVVGSGKAGLKTRLYVRPDYVQPDNVRPDYVRPDDEGTAYVEAGLQARLNGVDAAELLEGEWRERGGHRYLVIERKYSPGHRHGRVAVCDAAPENGVWGTLPLLLTRTAPSLD